LGRNKIRATRFDRKGSKSFRLKFLLIFLTPILLSSLYIWQRVTVITLSAQTKELRVKIKQQEKTLNYMQIEETKLSSIDRIQKKVEDMGFVQPPMNSIALIQESFDSTSIKKLEAKENVWAKLRSLKKNLLFGDKVEAKEIKHER
jgi:cell division protein FtsL